MALRKGHGNGKGVPRIEVLPPDELPEPMPVAPAPLARREDGTIADSEAAKALGARGGFAKAQKKKILHGMGLANVEEGNRFWPYWKAAQVWLEATIEVYAMMCGGALGPSPAALLGNAANALAWARYVSDKAAESTDERLAAQAGRFWDAMKQQQLAAYELGIREAKMRADLAQKPAMDVFEEALKRQQEQAEEPDDEPSK